MLLHSAHQAFSDLKYSVVWSAKDINQHARIKKQTSSYYIAHRYEEFQIKILLTCSCGLYNKYFARSTQTKYDCACTNNLNFEKNNKYTDEIALKVHIDQYSKPQLHRFVNKSDVVVHSTFLVSIDKQSCTYAIQSLYCIHVWVIVLKTTNRFKRFNLHYSSIKK